MRAIPVKECFRGPAAEGTRFVHLMSETTETPASFEAALAELEDIVAKLEAGDLPLQASLAAYRRGAALLAFCQAQLKDAQQQVQVLEKGVLRPLEPDENSDAQ
jgi:exodeoxyribonuclease VII small subunit